MLSIVIPCYNHNAKVKQAVRSALAQTYTDIEIIVVDDGSQTPVTLDQQDQRLRIVRHSENLGLPTALNTGIRESKGDRFVILAADDTIDPHHLEKTSVHKADIVSCHFKTEKGSTIKGTVGSVEALMDHNCHSYAALVTKAMWEKVGGFKSYMNPSWEDWEFWLSCVENGATWYHVGEPLHSYCRNPQGRDVQAQGKDKLLWAKMHGAHQDLYGAGMGMVAFIIPCYKHEQFVGEAVRDVMNQVYPHTMAVVVDDGSPGDVAKAVADVKPPDGRVIVVRQNNKGLSGARNAGITAALKYINPEYMVMLDADDGVDATFLEALIPHLEDDRYVYCDVKFKGDAWHTHKVEDYDCKKLVHKHLHQCTFLAPTQMYRDVWYRRGYAFDERMKEGYEDWEFEIAAVESDWCGKRVPGTLFHYRFHNEGSMRTEAKKVNDKLYRYIVGQHPWIVNGSGVMAGCTTCGGPGKFTRASLAAVAKGLSKTMFIPGIGDITPDEPVYVRYTGSTTSTITKVGMGGTIYKYSADPAKQARGYGPTFTIFAKDAHLFNGPYTMQRQPFESLVMEPPPDRVVATTLIRVNAPSDPGAIASAVHIERGSKPVELERARVTAPLPTTSVRVAPLPAPDFKAMAAMKQKKGGVEVIDLENVRGGNECAKDDFTKLTHVDEAGQTKLYEAGFSYYQDIVAAQSHELAAVLGLNLTSIGLVKASAARSLTAKDKKEAVKKARKDKK